MFICRDTTKEMKRVCELLDSKTIAHSGFCCLYIPPEGKKMP